MTDNEIRIAIAEKCGWAWNGGGSKATEESDSDAVLWWKPGDKDVMHYPLPDYPNDLNAVHEVENLWVRNREGYLGELAQVCLREMGGAANMTFATARQRCEALLRTWGIWKD